LRCGEGRRGERERERRRGEGDKDLECSGATMAGDGRRCGGDDGGEEVTANGPARAYMYMYRYQ